MTAYFPVSPDLDDELLARRLQIDASSDGFLATGAPTVGGGLHAKQIVTRTWIEGMPLLALGMFSKGAAKVHGVRSWLRKPTAATLRAMDCCS